MTDNKPKTYEPAGANEVIEFDYLSIIPKKREKEANVEEDYIEVPSSGCKVIYSVELDEEVTIPAFASKTIGIEHE